MQAMGGKEPVSHLACTLVHLSPLYSVYLSQYDSIYSFLYITGLNCIFFNHKKPQRCLVLLFPNRLVTTLKGRTLKREEVCNPAVLDFVFVKIIIMRLQHISIFFLTPAVDAQLDSVGFSFVKNSINAIETRGELKINYIPRPCPHVCVYL